jgi:hypothetical protein
MFESLKKLMSGPMFVFVYGILSKWYLMIAMAGLVVTFWVFKGLDEAGVLKATEEIVTKALSDTKAIARYCVPKINNISTFWSCLDNPPAYEKTDEEKSLEEGITKDLKTPQKPQSLPNADPYEENH